MLRAPRPSSPAPWVLVVDDDPLAARSTARVISATGRTRVTVLPDGDAAVKLLARTEHAPAAIVLDFELARGETGHDVLARLRAVGCRSPVAFLTGAPERASAALSSGKRSAVCPVLKKGPSAAALLGWLSFVLQGSPPKDASGVRSKLA